MGFFKTIFTPKTTRIAEFGAACLAEFFGQQGGSFTEKGLAALKAKAKGLFLKKKDILKSHVVLMKYIADAMVKSGKSVDDAKPVMEVMLKELLRI
jgi:hypothetical protein